MLENVGNVASVKDVAVGKHETGQSDGRAQRAWLHPRQRRSHRYRPEQVEGCRRNGIMHPLHLLAQQYDRGDLAYGRARYFVLRATRAPAGHRDPVRRMNADEIQILDAVRFGFYPVAAHTRIRHRVKTPAD